MEEVLRSYTAVKVARPLYRNTLGQVHSNVSYITTHTDTHAVIAGLMCI